MKATPLNRLLSRQKRQKKTGEPSPIGFNSRVLFSPQKQIANGEYKLCVSTLTGFEVVDIREVIYCEADESYAVIHLSKGAKIFASRSLHAFELLLQNYNFVRVHKSYLVNLQHIKHYVKGQGGTLVLSNSTEIEVSRRKRKDFLKAIKLYFIV